MTRVGELFLIPPVLSVPLLLGVLALGEGSGSTLPPVVWMGALGTYGTCSALYVFRLLRGQRGGGVCLQLLAQGVLLPLVALSAGSPSLVAWGGFAVFAAGLLAAVQGVLGSEMGEKPLDQDERGPAPALVRAVAQFPLPVLLTDTAGVVRGVSPSLVELLAPTVSRIEDQPVETLLDINATEGTFRGKRWSQEQVPLLEDGGVLFVLEPSPGALAPEPERSESRESGLALLNPQTGLFSEGFLPLRCEEELARDHRYRRWMTAILLRLSLTSVVTPAEERAVGETFGKQVKDTIRTCDVGFQLRNNDILLLLPETPLGGGQILVKRLYEQLETLMGNLAKSGMGSSYEFRVAFFFFKGTEPMHVHSLLGTLQASLKLFSEKDMNAESA